MKQEQSLEDKERVNKAIKRFKDSIKAVVGKEADGGVKVETQATIKTESNGDGGGVEAAVKEVLGEVKQEAKGKSPEVKLET